MPSPIAHSLMGYCLHNENAPGRRGSWTLLALLVFLANCPDLDFLSALFLGNIEVHRAHTHSLFFAVLSSVCVYAFLKLSRRSYAGRVARMTALGILSHLALDYFCGSHVSEGIAILWPMSDERVLSTFQLFPSLSWAPVIGLHNIRVALIEISIILALLLASSLHRLAGQPRRRPVPMAPERTAVLAER